MNMKKIDMRIQRNNNLNDLYFNETEELMKNNVPHLYSIIRKEDNTTVAKILFQLGPRAESTSLDGVLESDLLEIVRNRLQAHQKTEYATRENACALTHIEEALMWMQKRVDDRAEIGILGTNKVNKEI